MPRNGQGSLDEAVGFSVDTWGVGPGGPVLDVLAKKNPTE